MQKIENTNFSDSHNWHETRFHGKEPVIIGIGNPERFERKKRIEKIKKPIVIAMDGLAIHL